MPVISKINNKTPEEIADQLVQYLNWAQEFSQKINETKDTTEALDSCELTDRDIENLYNDQHITLQEKTAIEANQNIVSGKLKKRLKNVEITNKLGMTVTNGKLEVMFSDPLHAENGMMYIHALELFYCTFAIISDKKLKSPYSISTTETFASQHKTIVTRSPATLEEAEDYASHT